MEKEEITKVHVTKEPFVVTISLIWFHLPLLYGCVSKARTHLIKHTLVIPDKRALMVWI